MCRTASAGWYLWGSVWVAEEPLGARRHSAPPADWEEETLDAVGARLVGRGGAVAETGPTADWPRCGACHVNLLFYCKMKGRNT